MALIRLALVLTAFLTCQIGAAEDLVPNVYFKKDRELVNRTDQLVSAVCKEMETSELRWNGDFHQRVNHDLTVTTGIKCDMESRETGALATGLIVGLVDVCDLSKPNVVALRTVMEIRKWSLPDGCNQGSREVARRMVPLLLAKARSDLCRPRPKPQECTWIIEEYAYYKQFILGQDPYKPDEEAPEIPDKPGDQTH